MLLKLSKSSRDAPLKCKYRMPDGRDMYRASTPWEPFAKTTTIKKVYASSDRGREDETIIGRIEFRSSKMYFNGREYDFNSFFGKGSITLNGRKRSFVGPDGVQYVWKPLSGFDFQLYTEHGKHRTIVAYFTHKTFGSSTLEIFLSVEDMMCDWALVTFLYVYHKRLAQRNAAASGGGSAAAGGGSAAAAAVGG